MKTGGRSMLETLYCKLGRAYARNGLLSTLQLCLIKPWKHLVWTIRDLSPRERRYRSEENDFDRRHNVNTRVRSDAGAIANIASPNWIHGIGYQPVPSHDVAKIIGQLDIDYKEFVFVDLGAGKGRAMLVAAAYPFKRIIGVEYSPALANVLSANIASYSNPAQRCFELEAILGDAAAFELPPDPLVLFFHHPFELAVFRQVLSRIEQSLEQHPRDIRIIYYDPQCASVFDLSTHWRTLLCGNSNKRSHAASDWIVYGSCPDFSIQSR